MCEPNSFLIYDQEAKKTHLLQLFFIETSNGVIFFPPSSLLPHLL